MKTVFEEAKQYLPGGVNSPVRACLSVGTTPIFIEKAHGAYIEDIEGRTFIDYMCSWGPAILGHAPKKVVQAIEEVLPKGFSFGMPTLLETKMAKLICEKVPSIEMVRMVNSGTEATMAAIRLARGYTKRTKILKFQGSYHGHADSLLIKAGSGVAMLGLPDSPGVNEEVAKQTLTVPYNSCGSLREVFRQFGEEIAAVIVEPIAGNMGVVPPEASFLSEIRELTTCYGSLLIFDEVMTGFRVHEHSAQGLYQITPDLTCLGKIVGGGMPVGAYGGKKEIMEWIAPSGPVYQAGTLSGNPIALTCGYTTLKLLTKEVYAHLEAMGERLEKGLLHVAKKYGIPFTVNRVGSMLGFFFHEGPVINYETSAQSDASLFQKYYQQMLHEGIHLCPSRFEGMFISYAHGTKEIDATITAHERVLSKF